MKDLIRVISKQSPWNKLSKLADWTLRESINIQQIPAPTFAEEARAQYVAQRFTALGLADVRIDDQYNVYGLRTGKNRSIPALMVSAHTDTVFPAETDLTIREAGNIIYGPGLGDNSMGVGGMLAFARWLQDENITPDCDVWFVATSCEEGLGDLKGMRAAYNTLADKIGLVINLEGLAFGHIYHAGIAVHRMHITAQADGGHSWLHFGRPSAIHGIMELGAQITSLHPPVSPRTTFNIGMIEGGHAINAIGTKAGIWLDLRSESQRSLDHIRQQVLDLVSTSQRDGLRFNIEVVGNRPAGHIDVRHPIVRGALAALEQVNVRGTLETGSTDGNIPLQAGCPTVTIGVTRGGNAHRLDEYVEIAPIKSGLRQIITLALAATQYQREAHEKAAGD